MPVLLALLAIVAGAAVIAKKNPGREVGEATLWYMGGWLIGNLIGSLIGFGVLFLFIAAIVSLFK